MGTTIAPVTVVAHTIIKSVGRNGANNPDDIWVIKNMLNTIAPADGGAGGVLDEDDFSSKGPDFENMVNQIVIFQQVNFPETVAGKSNPFHFVADGLVSPERSTIKKMRLLIKRKQGGYQSPKLSLMPEGPIYGECNMTGFSAAGLFRTTSDWDSRSPIPEARQFVPLGHTRTLLVKMPGTSSEWGVHGYNSSVVGVEIEGNKLILSGRTHGITTMQVRTDDGGSQLLTVHVRTRSTYKLKCVQLGPPPADLSQSAPEISRKILHGVNAIFEPQMNVALTDGGTDTMYSIADGGNVVTFSPTRSILMTANQQFANPFSDLVNPKTLLAKADAGDTMTIFVHPMIAKAEHPTAIGSALALGGKSVWINSSAGALYILFLAHELGHSIGLRHITAARNENFLMNPAMAVDLQKPSGQPYTTGLNRQIIPCETLRDLG